MGGPYRIVAALALWPLVTACDSDDEASGEFTSHECPMSADGGPAP